MEGDEARYLASYNHSFKGLIQSKPQRPGFEHGGNLRRSLDFTWPVVTCFILTMAAFLLPRVLSILCILGVIYILFRLKCVLGMLLLSVLVGKIHKNHHERAVVYWTWPIAALIRPWFQGLRFKTLERWILPPRLALIRNTLDAS